MQSGITQQGSQPDVYKRQEHQVVELIKAVGEQVADGFLHARHRKVAGNLCFGIRLHKAVLCRDVLEVFARQHSRRNGKEDVYKRQVYIS